MAGGGDRQKFRDALDHAENYRPDRIGNHDGVRNLRERPVLLAYSLAGRNVKNSCSAPAMGDVWRCPQRDGSSSAGLTRASIHLRKSLFEADGWPRSSPAMT